MLRHQLTRPHLTTSLNSAEFRPPRLSLTNLNMSTEPVPSTSAAVGDTTPPVTSNEERQIAIRLTTKDSAYSIPSTKFLVPASWRRFHLSELINKVLENCEYSVQLTDSSL